MGPNNTLTKIVSMSQVYFLFFISYSSETNSFLVGGKRSHIIDLSHIILEFVLLTSSYLQNICEKLNNDYGVFYKEML